MKKNGLHIIIALTFILAACGQTPPPAQPTIDTVIDDATPSPLPAATQTTHPTETQTASVTPLPTIPTFTPTFDARTIVTATPASPAECPKEDPSLIPDFPIRTNNCLETNSCFIGGTENQILDFLNQGGVIGLAFQRLAMAESRVYALQEVRGSFGKFGSTLYEKATTLIYEDVTGDSLPDLVFEDFRVGQRVHILYCKNGVYKHYQTQATPEINYGKYFINSFDDMNLNGLPEIVVVQLNSDCPTPGFGCIYVIALEWDGNEFVNLSPDAYISSLQDLQIKDVDGNNTKEIIIKSYGYVPFYDPSRFVSFVYTWNGRTFSPLPEEFGPPLYRFQAIQDADRYITSGGIEKALSLYQDVIFNSNFGWWSSTRMEYETKIYNDYYYNPDRPTPEPSPVPDNSEYSRLAAYAYYRIMLLHIVQNHESDAGTVYNTLQQKFGTDPYGRPYVEMATLFWEAYQSTHKMYDGCAAAIQYAAEHPEILIPLGSDYHGWQSKTYKPEAVCPFR